MLVLMNLTWITNRVSEGCILEDSDCDAEREAAIVGDVLSEVYSHIQLNIKCRVKSSKCYMSYILEYS